MVSVTHLILSFAIVQNKFQQTNKNNITHINDNHIKFEVSLHFWGIWPTVGRGGGTNGYFQKPPNRKLAPRVCFNEFPFPDKN